MKFKLPIFAIAGMMSIGISEASLIITAAFDGPNTGGLPKGFELYATTAIADLSTYSVSNYNNGGTTANGTFTFPSVSVAAGTFIYIASESTQFTSFFGFAPTYTNGVANVNGDDAFAVNFGGGIVDVFGEIGVDGNGEPWEYLDGWAYRNDNVGESATFTDTDWTYSGVDGFEGGTTNETVTNPLPVGTFAIPEPSVALLGAVGLLGILRRRR